MDCRFHLSRSAAAYGQNARGWQMKKYVLVGAGNRGLEMFAKPMAAELKGQTVLSGVFDINPIRARLLSEECGGVPVYTDFQQMLKEARPDAVIVASIDHTHHTYIIGALEAGFDVISEKPLTTDSRNCQAILEAERRTGRKVTVTFNLRFVPYLTRIKELLEEDSIGQILHIDVEWFLDTSHGADYFRRWHGTMENSGGLLIHKSTHHFDLVNWWLSSTPQEVFASGSRNFYGPTRMERGDRCLSCQYQQSCEFYFDIEQTDFYANYYLAAEKEDGYIRDQCVFGDRINIYDNMSVNVKYESGAILTYSLVAYSPYEGWKATISGTKGRMEVQGFYSGPEAGRTIDSIRLFKHSGEVVTYDIPKAGGGHGGSDKRLRRMILVGDVTDPMGQQADSMAGAMSLMIGDAANRSIAEDRPVLIRELLNADGVANSKF